MPLIPILKPVLLILAWLAKMLAKFLINPSTAEKVTGASGATAGAIVGIRRPTPVRALPWS
jgi:hypothetical protein